MYLPLAAVVALVVVVAWLAGRQVLDRLIRSDESRRVLGPYLAAGAAVLVAVALGLRTLRRNQDYADEVRMYADVVRQRPLNPRAHLNLGLELMERGLKANLERMRQHFEVALRLMPELADTHNAMGIVHAEDGKLPEAVKEFETALELNPRLNEARFNMANALERQSKLTEAIRWYREGLKRNPYVPQVHIRLGTIYAELGNYSEAERSFRAAIELAPRRNEARLALGRLWHRQTRIEEAVQVFREAVRIDPGSAQAWHHLGAAEATRGNATSAEGCFRRALAADRSLAEASAGLRRIESIRAAASRRVRELRRRLRADGDDPQVMAALARVLAACMDESLRDGPRAVELAERACLATKRQDPECLDTLAAAYAEVGRFGDALDTAKLAGERAIQAGNTELALEIQRRRELYQAGRPYRQERWP